MTSTPAVLPFVLALAADRTRVAGRFKCEEHDVTFDAPIVKASGAK